MTHRNEPDATVEELQLVGGETTLEAHELTAAAAAAGLSVRRLNFASPEAQAAIAAQGSAAVRLPLVIVGGTYTLQRPPFTDVSECLAAVRAGDSMLPAGALAIGNKPRPLRERRAHGGTTSLWTVIGVAA
ncbi:MAG TPA: hypothetical protein VMA77_28340 [Solirubrobacteraceae bacterium]|nr:hypothetical protein [Solirubrobacteraceae bacterium]